MPAQRVVVTGMGIVSPLGLSVDEVWRHILAGKSGIKTLTHLDTRGLKTTVGGALDHAAFQAALADAGIRPSDITVDSTILAARQALVQAGLLTLDRPPSHTPMATIIGSAIGASQTYEQTCIAFDRQGVRGLRPSTVPRCMPNTISSQIAIRFKLAGPNYVVASACASSSTAIGIAFRMLRDGYARQALCGGGDTGLTPVTFASWNNLRVMSRNPDPRTACRPFDAARDGCVLGEGAACLVLETRAGARARGIPVLGELHGFGESSDCTHITAPNAEGQALAMRVALDDAGLTPEQIGYISAQGTATRSSDTAEDAAIRLATGAQADRIPVGALKAYVGHLLGASGAVECILTLKALGAGQAPANLNLAKTDPDSGIRLIGSRPEPIARPYALKNSFGFGGGNAVLVLSAGTQG